MEVKLHFPVLKSFKNIPIIENNLFSFTNFSAFVKSIENIYFYV